MENPYCDPFKIVSKAIVDKVEPPFLNAKNRLSELTDKQQVLLNEIHNQNLKLSETQHNSDLEDMFLQMKVYHNKLLEIKKDMKHIHERSTKLKKRALRIQQLKEKEIIIRKQDVKEAEILIGSSSSS